MFQRGLIVDLQDQPCSVGFRYLGGIRASPAQYQCPLYIRKRTCAYFATVSTAPDPRQAFVMSNFGISLSAAATNSAAATTVVARRSRRLPTQIYVADRV